jgi:hypothetical protein
MTDEIFRSAREFIYGNARLLEQRLFAALFEGAAGHGVVDALRGYQNDDGGFGHGLEPDKRCPASLPGDVEFALRTLVAAGVSDRQMVRRACDYLASVAEDTGAVPLAFPVIERYPRAEHWGAWTYQPGVFPTAGLAGLLHAMGVDHPWLDTATAYCWATLDTDLPDDAHALAAVLLFCEHVPDRQQAATAAARVVERLPAAAWYRTDPDDPAYGVTPLHLAPTPDSRWRDLFADEGLDGHLARLARDQQPDGGWPISWQPPSDAAALEWRGIETMRALNVLSAHGMIRARSAPSRS